MDSSSTGRRPKRSDSAPRSGEHTNCIPAQVVPKIPYHSAARAVSPPRKPLMSCGSTGMTIPNATMSSTSDTKMKARAARRGTAGRCWGNVWWWTASNMQPEHGA
jgi:hypothetical protein